VRAERATAGRQRQLRGGPGGHVGAALAKDSDIEYLPGASGERALSARLLRGEEPALAELYALHAPWVLRLLVRFLRSPALAEDALQETFLAAFKSVGSLRRASSIRGWLGSIAVRKALNLHRASGRRLRMEAQAPGGPEPDPDPGARDLARRVLSLMQQLSPEKRLALLLVSEGYTAAEIAELTGEERNTVLSRIFRARIELAKLAVAAGIVLPDTRKEPGT
jgi:RNA polymerase sigma-70 factor (ECF subfamily)